MICIIRVTPSIDPIFHQMLMFDGVGKSINLELIAFVIGCALRIGKKVACNEITLMS